MRLLKLSAFFFIALFDLCKYMGQTVWTCSRFTLFMKKQYTTFVVIGALWVNSLFCGKIP